MQFLPRRELLTLEEMARLCGAFIDLGVRKLRLTGGEPLVRRDVMTLIRALGEYVGAGRLDELTLTTNGTRLDEFADALHDAGIRRVNVSLDTLDAAKFRHITRRDSLDTVLRGIDTAERAGLKVKLNVVALRDVNENEFDRMIEWCGARGFDLTFIEAMPLGELEDGERMRHYLPISMVRANLRQRWTLLDDDYRTGGPARYMRVAETGGRIGFITPMTHNFCESCNRVRLTCTGTLFLCLGQHDRAEFRHMIRDGANPEQLAAAIREAIGHKPRGHDFMLDRRQGSMSVARHMSTTGG